MTDKINFGDRTKMATLFPFIAIFVKICTRASIRLFNCLCFINASLRRYLVLGRRNKAKQTMLGLVVVLLTYYMYQTLTMPVRFLFTNDNINTQCIIPDLDPFDKSIMKFVWHPDPIRCDPTPSLMYIDDEGFLKLNVSSVHYYGKEDFKCSYRILLRHKNDDYHVTFGDAVEFKPPVKVPADFIRVTCTNVNSKTVYDNLHVNIDTQKVRKEKDVLSEDDSHFSVFMFGLDSTSRLSAIRKLTKTYEYITKELKAFVFKGYMKVADNTFPNLVPVLTGKRAWTNELPLNNYIDDPIDNFPFIWKNFSQAKYVTYFAEDYPEIATFNTNAGGFLDEPTDHYMRPFMLGMKKIDLVQFVLNSVMIQFEYSKLHLRKQSSLCFGNQPRHAILIDYYRRFVRAYKNQRRFGFSWLTEICHEFINFLELGDEDIFKFFKFLKEDGHLDRAFLIFYSDHGSRIDDIRNTFVGRIEERMPLLSIIVPNVLLQKYPDLQQNLQENSERLTTNFDLHETLKDIVQGNYDLHGVLKKQVPSRGVSLFKPISNTRSCAEAWIPENYCACYKSDVLNPNDPVLEKVANFIVHHINNLLTKYKDMCAKLKLLKVQEAQLISSGLSAKGEEETRLTFYKFISKPEKEKHRRYLVVLETVPGNALFEGTVDYHIEKGFEVLGDISRTNKYGNQSHCVKERRLKLYCLCNS
ncbi:hypothetical protein ACJMK2_031443 [Sinanodonta woodiana]|uniref:DUF229 domain containing protein n=1 Tax=Sinanodonta woodiana TaxID=1069815 RepID=A0ABD3WZC4_SINWO